MAHIRNAPQNEVAKGIVVIPSTDTALSSTDTWLKHLFVTNTTGTAATVTVKDSTGKYIANQWSVPANGGIMITADDEDYLFLSGGLTWSQGTASALQAEVCAFKV